MTLAAAFGVINCFAGDDIAEVQEAMLAAKESLQANTPNGMKASVPRLRASAASDSVTYTASGDLDNVVGSGNLNFRFVVDKPFTEITSAKLEINAYDVDYPSANEHDKVYFNGTFIGRLKGVNGDYEVNTFSLSPSLVKCPASEGGTAVNTFSVAVNVDNGGWVTGVGWAKLTISGETFKLTASTDDPRGIELKWNDVGDRYEVYRRYTVNGKWEWHRIYGNWSASTCIDKNVMYGEDVHYYVVANTGAKSNEATGMKGGNGKMPAITEVDVGDLWLTDAGPYWCFLKWNDFDKGRYYVSSISFELIRVSGHTPALWPIPTVALAEGDQIDVFDVSFGNTCLVDEIDASTGAHMRPGRHGRHKLKVTWEVIDKGTGVVVENGTPREKWCQDVGVFFNKFSTEDHWPVPNWAYYWPKDGAIKPIVSGTTRDDGRFRFDYSLPAYTLGEHTPRSERVKIATAPKGFPDIFRLSGHCTHKYSLGMNAACRGSVISSRYYHDYTGEDVGSDEVGVKALAATIAHEIKHGEIAERLYGQWGQRGWPLVKGNANTVQFMSLAALKDALDAAGYDKSSYRDYYNAIEAALESGQYETDSDGDGIPDVDETGGEYGSWGFSRTDPDTFNIASCDNRFAVYASCGDNEVLARSAEERNGSHYLGDVNKDWAWPGYNTGNKVFDLGREVTFSTGEKTSSLSRHKMMSLFKADWDMVLPLATALAQRTNRRTKKDMSEVIRVAQSRSSPRGLAKHASAQSLSVAPNTAKGDGGEEVLSWHGSETDLPDIMITTGDVHVVSCQYGEAAYDSSGRIESLSWRLVITNETDEAASLLLKCHVTDSSTNALAWTAINVECAVGLTTVNVNFYAEDMRVKEANRLLLYAATLKSAVDDIGWIESEQMLCSAAETVYSPSDFANDKGWIVPESVAMNVSGNGVAVSGLVFRASDESATMQFRLADTNGLTVASAIVPAPCLGTNSFELLIPGADLYRIARPLPYVAESLSLVECGNTVHEIVDIGEIEASSVLLFRPSNLPIRAVPDSGAWSDPVCGADGFVNQIAYELLVSNVTSQTLPCHVTTALLGTNDEYVCAFDMAIELTPGTNTLRLAYSSVELLASEYRGCAYHVGDVVVTVDDDDESIEIYHANDNGIEIETEQLGEAPFALSGDVVCRTGDVFKPIIVEVPIDVMRAGDISASAIVTDTNGEFVVRAETNLTFSAGSNQTVTVEFTARDLISTGIPGPYVVHYLVLRSGYDGVGEVRIEEFREVVDYRPILYVDAEGGDDEADGFSAGTALKTMRAALSVASDGTEILVSAGDYVCPAGTEGETFLNVAKKVALIATDGDPAKTRIVGLRGSSTNDVRGVWLAEGAMLSGFTVSNFQMAAGGGVGIYGEGLGAVVSNCVVANCSATHDGGGIYQCTVYDSTIRNCRAQNGGGAAQSTLVRCLLDGNTATQYGGGIAYGTATNCVIRNCTASYGGGGSAYARVVDSLICDNRASNYGGGLHQGKASRCTIKRNKSNYYGGGMRQGIADNCVFFGNTASSYGGGTHATVTTNCTIVGNAAGGYGGGMYGGTAYNSIVWGNALSGVPASSSQQRLHGNLSSVSALYTCSWPLPIGEGNIAADPCLLGEEFGVVLLKNGSPCIDAGSQITTNGVAIDVGETDIVGCPRVLNGQPDMGAYEGGTNALLVVARLVGVGVVDPEFSLVNSGDEVRLVAMETTRPFVHFKKDGAVLSEEKEMTVVVNGEENVVIDAVFESYDFYVDAQSGDDANDGLSWATAKRTIQAAIDCAVDGEKIWVAKGVYEPIVTNDKGVTIEAVDGALATSIDGGGTNRCATLATSGSLASKTNSVLVGFTLTNGRAASGAGAYGGTLKNCVIKSNTADGSSYCYGGGTYYGVQCDCRYENNSVSATMYGYGGAAYYGTSYSCSYVNNSVYGPTNAYGGAIYYGAHYDCGITNNTSSMYGGGVSGGTYYRTSVVRNEAKWGGGCYSASFYDGEVLRNTASQGGGTDYGNIYRSVISYNKTTSDGGGAYKSYLTDCVVLYNQSGGSGGGALLTEYSATRTVFRNNIARGSGGGVYGGTCNDCGFTNNTASSYGGGAYNITANRSSFTGNSAATGGGIYNGTYNSCIVEGNSSSGEGGGAYYGTFYDSIISGNHADGVGGGLRGSTFHRTRVIGNRSYGDGGGVYNGSGYNSLIVKNNGLGNGGGTYGGNNYNCTITENWCGGNGGGTSGGYQYNTIIVDNTNPDGEYNRDGGSYYNCLSSNAGNPRFANPKEGDYRLRVGSPCINAGNNSYANGSTDLALATRIQGGTVDMGAYEGGVAGLLVTVDSVGAGDLSRGSSLIANGGSFAISAQSTGRAFLHFLTNGVVATTSPALALEGIAADVKVTAVFAHEMFVDGTAGNDANDGLSWATAKKSIQAAIDTSVNGDTIWVADGVYAPISTSDRRIDIVSVNGADKTIIDGGGASCCAYLGTDYRLSNNSRLSGFTLRNGFSGYGGGAKYGRVDNCIVENCRATTNGGGVDYSNISNCVIRSCSAQASGGGLTIGTWRRAINCKFIGNVARENGGGATGNAVFRYCEFFNNIAGGNGGGMYDGTAYDSIFTGNRAAAGGATYNGTFYRCTLAGNTSTGEGGGAYSGTFYDSVISNNVASSAGGGLRGSTFHRSHIVGNKASGDGGGVYNGTGYNSIIAKNKTRAGGGGTSGGYNYNCTVFDNFSANNGGGTLNGYQYNSIVWGNRKGADANNCYGGSTYNCHTANPKFVNAAEGDYRLRFGSPCLNAGNASYVNGSLDVARRTRVQDGTVDIGAHEGAIEGFVVNVVLHGGATIKHSSVVVGNNGSFTVYTLDCQRPFTGILTNGVFASSTVPFTLTGITSDVELTVECVHDLYVDAVRGSDANSGFSREGAKRSIQAAINISLPDDVIHVADGWYSPFSTGNRVIRITSDNGPENCIVDGDYSARCATLGGSPIEVQTTIDGLTLCNGYSSAGGGCYYGTAVNCIIEDCYSTGDGGGSYGTLLHDCTFVGNVAGSNGGATCGDRVIARRCTFADNVCYGSGGGAYGGVCTDCVFNGNKASSNGGAAYGSWMARCTMRGNQASYGGGTYNGTMHNCLYYDNYATSTAGGAYYGTLYNCTLTRNKAAGTTGGMYYSTAYNTISYGNRLNNGSGHDYYGGSFYNCCLTGSSGSNSVFSNPLFFDPSNGDFRLSMNSPCLNKGNNSNVSESTDLRGQARIKDGTVDIGCYEGPVYVWQINAVACGAGRVVASGASVLDGGELSFTAIEDGSPFIGFYTNGVFATADKDFVWRGISANGTLEAWFKQDYYVNAAMPDDSGDGLTWQTARKDLAAVVAESSNGANIWVKGGTYSPIVSQNKHLFITAVDGKENTVISGDAAHQCANLVGSTSSISLQTNTVLAGFTLRDGFAANGGGAAGGTLRDCAIVSNVATNYGGGTYYGMQYDCVYRANVVSNDAAYARGGGAYNGTSYNCLYTNNLAMGATYTYGGAVYGGTHYDCTMSNNKSSLYGGGVYSGTYHRCSIVGNSAQYGGGCCGWAQVRDSFIAGNAAYAGGGANSSVNLYGCTVVDNVATNVGGVNGGYVYNSIVWGNKAIASANHNWNSGTWKYSCSEPLASGEGNICADPLFADVTNGNYRLTAVSPCLNVGYNGYVSSLGKDFEGKDRVKDGIVDMGCYEGVFSFAQETATTPIPVPYSWLDDNAAAILATCSGEYETAAHSTAANDVNKVWECYVAGLNPTNATDVFRAVISMENGAPVVRWEPDLNENGTKHERVYTVEGKENLTDKWAPTNSASRFFRVKVEMP